MWSKAAARVAVRAGIVLGVTALSLSRLSGVALAVPQSVVLTSCDASDFITAVSGGGTVDVDCAGTITLTSPLQVTGVVTIDASKAPTPGLTLSGGKVSQLFQVESGASLTIDDLTITDAEAIGPSGGDGKSSKGRGQDGASGAAGRCGAYYVPDMDAPPGQAGFPGSPGSQGGSGDSGVAGMPALGGAIDALKGSKVTVTDSTFSDDMALGGNGGNGGYGGGGGSGGTGGVGGCGGFAALPTNAGNGFNGGEGGVGGAGGDGGDGGNGGNGGKGGSATGGAIYSAGKLSLTDDVFSGDSAVGGNGGYAGYGGSAGSGGYGGAGGQGGSGNNSAVGPPTGRPFIGGSGGPAGSAGQTGSSGQPGNAGRGGSGGSASGGAVYSSGPVKISGVTFSDTSATGGDGGDGGLGASAPSHAGTSAANGGLGGGGGLCLMSEIPGSNACFHDYDEGNGGNGGYGAAGLDGSNGGDGGNGGSGGSGEGGGLYSGMAAHISGATGFQDNNVWGGLAGVGGVGGAGGDGGRAGNGGNGGGQAAIISGTNQIIAQGKAGMGGKGGNGGDGGDGGDGGAAGNGGFSMGGAVWAVGTYVQSETVTFANDVSHGAPVSPGGDGGMGGVGGHGGTGGRGGSFQMPPLKPGVDGTPGIAGMGGQGASDGAQGNLGAGSYDDVYSAVVDPLSAPDEEFDGAVGETFDGPLQGEGGTTPYSWALASGSTLPPGLSLQSTGAITGIPTASGKYRATVDVSDSSSPVEAANATVSFDIARALTAQAPNTVSGTIGHSLSAGLSADGGTGSYTWSLATGALPPGVTLSPQGDVSGFPTEAGNWTFTATVSDTSVPPDSVATTPIVVHVSSTSLQVPDTNLPLALVGVPYSQQIEEVGGTAPYTFTMYGGSSLPSGLSLSHSGLVSGVPTTAGQGSSANVQITDASGQSIEFSLGVYVDAVDDGALSVKGSPPVPIVGEPYSFTYQAVGGTAPYTWSLCPDGVEDGEEVLPPGLSFDAATATISGTVTGPSANGEICVEATDSSSPSQTTGLVDNFLVTDGVSEEGLTNTSATVGDPYQGWLFAGEGTAPFTWSMDGQLPPGLTFNPDAGDITGTPSSSGYYTFDATATDALGATATASFVIDVETPTSRDLQVTTFESPPGSLGHAYSTTLDATGGEAPYTWSATGALPPGLSLSPTSGVLSGIPTMMGTFDFTAQVTDSSNPNPETADVQLEIDIGAGSVQILSSTLPDVYYGQYSEVWVSATGGAPPYTWALASGSAPLPPGLSLGSSGNISGTPTAAGTFQFDVQATDSTQGTPLTASAELTLTVAQLEITSTTMEDGVVGQSYDGALTATGGTEPFTWSLTSGKMPPGLSFNSAGYISGTPTTPGSFAFSLEVTDSTASNGAGLVNQTASASLTLDVVASATAPTEFTADSPPISAEVGVPYQASFAANGSPTPTYSLYSVEGGISWLTIDAQTGAVSGTPPPGTASFDYTVIATNPAGEVETQDFYVFVTTPGVAIATSSLYPGTLGAPYSALLQATDGTAPYTWSITSGVLPPGLGLNATTGALTGTPTSVGTYNVTVQVLDSEDPPTSSSRSFSLDISDAPLMITTDSLPIAETGVEYSGTLAASGGSARYTWSVDEGSLPTGLTLDGQTGVISGVPTSSGTYVVGFGVADADGDHSSSNLALVVGSPETLSGQVTDTETGNPLSDICVQVFQSATDTPTGYSTCTVAGGDYLIAVPAGTYTLEFTDSSGVYPTTWYGGSSTWSGATPVTVGAAPTLANLAMTAPTTIEGLVTDSSGTPVVGACVSLYSANGSKSLGYTTCTNTQGNYVLQGMPAGTYTIKFVGPNDSYETGWYASDGLLPTSPQGATPVTIEAGDIGNVDAVLDTVTSIQGTITDASTGQPIAGVCAHLYDSNQEIAAGESACSDSSGNFDIVGVQPGDYAVEFTAAKGSGYSTQWYESASSFAQATTVATYSGEIVSDVNAAMIDSNS